MKTILILLTCLFACSAVTHARADTRVCPCKQSKTAVHCAPHVFKSAGPAVDVACDFLVQTQIMVTHAIDTGEYLCLSRLFPDKIYSITSQTKYSLHKSELLCRPRCIRNYRKALSKPGNPPLDIRAAIMRVSGNKSIQ